MFNDSLTRVTTKTGSAVQDVPRSKLYPSVSLKKHGEEISVNFGQEPFVYNIDDMMNVCIHVLLPFSIADSRMLWEFINMELYQEQRESILRDIQRTDTSHLEPGMNETDLIQTLVLQFLQHDGYVETARAFAEDMKLQKEALNLNPNVTVDGVNIKDDEDANNRQRKFNSAPFGSWAYTITHSNLSTRNSASDS